MNLDIETTVRTIFFLMLAVAVGLLTVAFRAFREAGRLRFFLKKRELLGRAWQFVFFAALVIVVAILINGYAEPATYRFFQPSPTASQTPTITSTPTITLTPTVTRTATITPTLEFTRTPELPAVISEGFTSEVTPNPNAVFSGLQFSRRLTGEYLPVDPADTFANPIDELYGSFSYDSMAVGTQWTALWFRDGELVCYETIPWNGASGGYGYTECLISAEEWLPGDYEVQIYVGEEWKASGIFSISGAAPTSTYTPTLTPTLSPTVTLTPTITLTPSVTVTPTKTLTPTQTVAPTQTRTSTLRPTSTRTLAPSATLTRTLTSTNTPRPTRTATATRTTAPTLTLTATLASTATLTPTISPIPSATLVPTATRYSTIFR